MPMELQYLPNGGVLLKGVGMVTFRDIKEINEEIYGTKDKILKLSYQICDFISVTGIPLSSEEVKSLAEQDKYAGEINPHMIIATVGEVDVVYGLARMWQAYTDGSPIKTKVFRNMSDAQRWIATNMTSRKSGKTE